MATVVIEGTGSSVLLARGERRTVQLTDVVERRIARGYFKLIARLVHEPAVPAEAPSPADHTGVTVDDPGGVDPLPTGDFEQVAPAVSQPPPSKSASAEAWRAWFDSQGIAYPQDATRDQLAAGWEAIEQQRGAAGG